MATHSVYGPVCLYALLTTSGHAPDESAGGNLEDLFPDLDQGISELMDRVWGYFEELAAVMFLVCVVQ